MSQSSSAQGSFISRMSIRRKLFLSFVLILFFILVQSFVSINATQQFSSSYNTISLQQQYQDEAGGLRSNVRQEQIVANNWMFGVSLLARESFNSVNINTNNSVLALSNLQIELENLDSDGRLNTTYLIDEADFLNNELDNLDFLVKNSIFGLPGMGILDDMIHSLESMELFSSQIAATTLEFILTNDSSVLIPLFAGNLIADMVTENLVLSQTNDLLSDPNSLLGRAAGLNINQTLYQEIDTIISINIDEPVNTLRTRVETIQGLINGSIFEMSEAYLATIYNAMFILVNQVDDIVGGIELLHDKLEALKSDIFILNTQLNTQIGIINDHLLNLINWASSERAELAGSFAQTFENQVLIILSVIAVAISLVLVVQYFINSQISKPVKSITYWSQLISEGDLSKTQASSGRSDEIGTLQDNFRQMNRNLREIINEVQKSSSLITNTSDDLSTSAQEINATAEEVSAIAQTMAKGSTEQAEIITTIVQELQSASDVVESVVIQITENLDIIKDLSEQTNILALNTAIEAANAGDMARGFQVIAENIRKMSEQSKRTSKRVSKDSREILEQLRDSFNHITTLIENVASVSEETAASAEEVAASAEEMTASMESIAASSAILSDQSAESLEKVNRFKLEEKAK